MEQIGEYVIKRLLGEGGMGRVYEAEERLSQRRVALKVLRPDITKSEEGRRAFLNEMRILALLEHRNLVRSLASMETDGQLVMVLELLDGRTLRDELSAGPLRWGRAVEIVVQIASALEVTHRQVPQIIHRDLKPENVMVIAKEGAPLTVKVMDFGVAKILESAARASTQSVGTLQYMSPEQIDATGVDGRSDLYALGLIFYEMLAGAPPFQSPSPRELLNLQCTKSPPPFSASLRSELPRGVVELIFALLAKNPDERPANASEVIRLLEPFRPQAEAIPGESVPLDREPRSVAAAIPATPSGRQDTVAVLQSAPSAVRPRRAIATILVVSALSFFATLGARTFVSRVGPAPVASASAR